MKRKISWLTGSNFFNVDEPLMSFLQEEFDIYWIILIQKEDMSCENAITELLSRKHINYKIYKLTERMRSFRTFNVYRQVIYSMMQFKPDLYYFDCLGMPYLFPLVLSSCMERKRVMYACHDFVDHVGVKNRKYIQLYKKLIYSTIPNIKLFSKTQYDLFTKSYCHKKCFYTPLALQSYGEPTVQEKPNLITFLFYGSIRENKGLEFLIKAANIVGRKHKGKFIVKIYGFTRNWNYYKNMMEDESVFDYKIEFVKDEDVANLFVSSHYLVLPYRDVSQSGPLSVAYYYNIPVIASNHKGFTEFIVNSVNGFLFKNEDAIDLARVMCSIIEGDIRYDQIKQNQLRFTEVNLKTETIARKYIMGFNSIIKEQLKSK